MRTYLKGLQAYEKGTGTNKAPPPRSAPKVTVTRTGGGVPWDPSAFMLGATNQGAYGRGK